KKYGIKNINIEIADFSYDSSKIAARNLLKNKKLDAIICSTDRQAHSVYMVAKEMGLKIPDDISVISFGGYEIDEIIEPELSTIKFDSFNAGVSAANTLINLINNINVEKVFYIDYKFIEGKSVK
ncbi:substrate-binding domain-containing protein, partial [Brachyspira pilosicoli]|uniref:substrate-binding domain-containing protein n=1 Tax=Brachyspira pilosicoli TaxID=52584 RepID=UPI001CA5E707